MKTINSVISVIVLMVMLEGITPGVLARCDVHVRIPTLGTKGSINVASAGGVVLYELLRKYRAMARG